MKLYKFRPLVRFPRKDCGFDCNRYCGSQRSECDYWRLKHIIETGEFWCSPYYELNDPMEGVYRVTPGTIQPLQEHIAGLKSGVRVASLSSCRVLKSLPMWGYYGGGFRGAVVEIETKVVPLDQCRCDGSVVQVDYVSQDAWSNGANPLGGANARQQPSDPHMMALRILTTKLNVWEHEHEYRFLIESPNSQHKIGQITGVYISRPYPRTLRRHGKSIAMERLCRLAECTKELWNHARCRCIATYCVTVRGGKIVCRRYGNDPTMRAVSMCIAHIEATRES